MSNHYDDMRNAVSGRPDLVASWIQQVNKTESEEKRWVSELIVQGFKAAHPNDGWVDREKNTIHLMYPQFNLGVDIGDKMVLGSHYDDPADQRKIKIIGVSETYLLHRFKFEYIDEEGRKSFEKKKRREVRRALKTDFNFIVRVIILAGLLLYLISKIAENI